MKKLEKLKGRHPSKYFVTLDDNRYLDKLKEYKYIIFKYKDDENKFIWKFIKTEKIEKIEFSHNENGKVYYKMYTTVENRTYMTDKNSYWVTREFTLAKVMCDEENKKERIGE